MPAGKSTPSKPRNYEIAPGLSRFSKARLYHKKGMWLKLKKPFQAKPKTEKKGAEVVKKPIGGDKNGKERVISKKSPKLLSLSQKAKKVHRKVKLQPLRKSITPGTILIILVGRHRGKRVVFLKQLEKSGLLLVTGPLKLNSTPLRRIAQAFVIATNTKVDVQKVNVPDHINDDYFKKKEDKGDKSKNGIFATPENQEYVVSEQRKKDQKAIDDELLNTIRAHPERKALIGYLGSRFSLGKGDHPHKMNF